MNKSNYIPRRVAQEVLNKLVGSPVKLCMSGGRCSVILFAGTEQQVEFGGHTNWMALYLQLEHQLFHSWLTVTGCTLEKKEDGYLVMQQEQEVSPKLKNARQVYNWWFVNRETVKPARPVAFQPLTPQTGQMAG